MMTKDEALKMAIEAMSITMVDTKGVNDDGHWTLNIPYNFALKAIQACREALEQPAQEPVAWNEEEFNSIAYAYRTCPAHEVKMVSERYQELVDYVLYITHPAP